MRSIRGTTRRRRCARQLNKVFPTHWSFLLGEIALYSFIVLLLTGMYLTLFFDPSMAEVTYNGVYQPLRGVQMSRAYETALNITFEVRGGLFVRQIHHWAALLFAASIMVHLARIFFTGAFRKPARGQLGHRLAAADPGDVRGLLRLLAARRPALRHRPAGRASLDHVGHPGHRHLDALAAVRRRLPRRRSSSRASTSLHILLLPGIILALIGVHLALVWFQKHTQFPGPGRTENNVVGVRVMPVFAAKSGAFFA